MSDLHLLQESPHSVIAVFGMAPVELKLVDPNKPGWRKL